jgi:hypothetical protein
VPYSNPCSMERRSHILIDRRTFLRDMALVASALVLDREPLLQRTQNTNPAAIAGRRRQVRHQY